LWAIELDWELDWGFVSFCQAMERLWATVATTKELKKSPFMGQKKEESSRPFWREPSRASGSSFSALCFALLDPLCSRGKSRLFVFTRFRTT